MTEWKLWTRPPGDKRSWAWWTGITPPTAVVDTDNPRDAAVELFAKDVGAVQARCEIKPGEFRIRTYTNKAVKKRPPQLFVTLPMGADKEEVLRGLKRVAAEAGCVSDYHDNGKPSIALLLVALAEGGVKISKIDS